ncbi:hypothetical protein, partial [Rhodoblastus sp.]|uniref:hypothetical protein n=1 Tax=Rhodoblastus sp. TaxID=1962975 RepID=UPI0025CBB882
RITLNNAMSITPKTPADASREKFKHGSNLSGNARPKRVSSQWQSTANPPKSRFERLEARFSLGRPGMKDKLLPHLSDALLRSAAAPNCAGQ